MSIEFKLQHGALDAVLEKGLEQTADYADKCRADEAHLALFNRNPNVNWDDNIWRRTRNSGGVSSRPGARDAAPPRL